jgi:hypothetical protein
MLSYCTKVLSLIIEADYKQPLAFLRNGMSATPASLKSSIKEIIYVISDGLGYVGERGEGGGELVPRHLTEGLVHVFNFY